MNSPIDEDDLRIARENASLRRVPTRDKKHIMIGVCLRSMETRWETTMAILELLSKDLGYTFELIPAGGGSVCMARNLLLHHWHTKSKAGRLVFLDSDVIALSRHWTKLLEHDHPFIAGMYPLKDLHFRWSFNGEAKPWSGDGKLLEVFEVCTGFLMLDYERVLLPLLREQDEFIIEDAPYRGDVGHHVLQERIINKRLHSEDFYLSWLVREVLQLPILVDPFIQCGHVGDFNYLRLVVKEQADAKTEQSQHRR